MKRHVSKKIGKVSLKSIERKFIDGKQILYQEDLEKLLGQTLDVPGAYFNHAGGGKYWNVHGNDLQPYYYRSGCQRLLDVLKVSSEEKDEIMKYFYENNNNRSQGSLSVKNVDEILNTLICNIDYATKKKVVVYIDKLLKEQERFEAEYNEAIARFEVSD